MMRVIRRIPLLVIGCVVTMGYVRVAAIRDDVTVRGCVERDAASSAAIYKLIAAPSSTTRIYRLSAPKEIGIASHVGHTVEVTGVVTAPPSGRGSRPEPELVVKKLTLISETCPAG